MGRNGHFRSFWRVGIVQETSGLYGVGSALVLPWLGKGRAEVKIYFVSMEIVRIFAFRNRTRSDG